MWGWPITLGLLTVFGLISALFSDGGLGDVLAWFALGIPVVVCAMLLTSTAATWAPKARWPFSSSTRVN